MELPTGYITNLLILSSSHLIRSDESSHFLEDPPNILIFIRSDEPSHFHEDPSNDDLTNLLLLAKIRQIFSI